MEQEWRCTRQRPRIVTCPSSFRGHIPPEAVPFIACVTRQDLQTTFSGSKLPISGDCHVGPSCKQWRALRRCRPRAVAYCWGNSDDANTVLTGETKRERNATLSRQRAVRPSHRSLATRILHSEDICTVVQMQRYETSQPRPTSRSVSSSNGKERLDRSMAFHRSGMTRSVE